jgi:hypothetical protein
MAAEARCGGDCWAVPAARDRGRWEGKLPGAGGSSSSIPTPTPTKFWRWRESEMSGPCPRPLSRNRASARTDGRYPALPHSLRADRAAASLSSAWSDRLATVLIGCSSACLERVFTPSSYGSAKSDGGVAKDGQVNLWRSWRGGG